MKYFGCLKPELIENFNGKKIANFLIKNKLYERVIKEKYELPVVFTNSIESIDIDSNEIYNKTTFVKNIQIFFIVLRPFIRSVAIQLNNQLIDDINYVINTKSNYDIQNTIKGINKELQPTQYLLDDFYQFVIEFYNHIFIDVKCSFFEEFNEETYGLEYNDRKTIALKHYKDIYKSQFENNKLREPITIDDLDGDIVNLDIDFFKTENKLKIVNGSKLRYQHKLTALNSFFEYLIGDESILDTSFYIKNKKIIDQILIYEARKDIMVELNNEFNFEEDFYFTNSMEDKRKYEEYDEIFNSFKAYKFTDNLIKTFAEDEKANIESLYEFLRVNNLAKKGKRKFFEYLKNEHKIVLTKIVSYINYDDRKDFPVGGKKPNDEHIKRVNIIEEKWALFT